MTTFDDLKLYILPGCPFCAKVIRFMDEHDISVERLDVTEGTNGDDLMRIGGKRQCPCLVIGERPLYESGDIIDYLADRMGVRAPRQETSAGGACTFTPGGGHVCE